MHNFTIILNHSTRPLVLHVTAPGRDGAIESARNLACAQIAGIRPKQLQAVAVFSGQHDDFSEQELQELVALASTDPFSTFPTTRVRFLKTVEGTFTDNLGDSEVVTTNGGQEFDVTLTRGLSDARGVYTLDFPGRGGLTADRSSFEILQNHG